jgi:hypothetical protein
VSEPTTQEAAQADLDFAPQPRPELICVELDGEAVVYERDGGTMYRLSHLATTLWDCFDGRTTLRELAADLASAVPESADSLLEQLLAFADELSRQGLLVEAPRRPPETVA